MLKKISEIYKELEAIGAKPEIITAQGIGIQKNSVICGRITDIVNNISIG